MTLTLTYSWLHFKWPSNVSTPATHTTHTHTRQQQCGKLETKRQIPIQFKSKIGLREAYSISIAKTQIKTATTNIKKKKRTATIQPKNNKEQQLATLKIETLKECFIVWLFLHNTLFLRFTFGFCIMCGIVHRGFV